MIQFDYIIFFRWVETTNQIFMWGIHCHLPRNKVHLLISKQQMLLWMKVGQKDTSDSEELLTQCLQLRQNLKWLCLLRASLTQLPNLIHSLCSHSLQTPKPDTPEDPKPMDTKPEKPEESMRNCLRFPFNRPLSLRGARMGKTLGVVPGCEIMCGSHKRCSLVREFTRCHCFRLVNYYYVSFEDGSDSRKGP